MSLYRTYRPKTFADVVGQDHIISTLAQAVEQDKLSHAYLFAGTRGTGKTSTARILANILLTHGLKDAKLKEQVIKAVDDGNLVDLIEIDAASNTGVDNMRDLIEKIQFTPVVAGAKVYIIDEVHMLSKGAFNALLKTLEEPPAYAFFILATTELHKIPATIQSRCQRFLFRQINEQDIVGRLRYIADQESIQVEEEALAAIAHHVQGGMRDAISLLDQLRSLERISLNDVKERVGETGHAYVEQVRAAIMEGNKEAIVTAIRALEETGVPLENFVRLLLESARKNLHAAVKEKRPTAAYEPLLETLLKTIRDIRVTPVPGLVLESALFSLCKRNESSTVENGNNQSAPTQVPQPATNPSTALRTGQQPATPAMQKPTPAETPRAEVPAAVQTALHPAEHALSLAMIREKWSEMIGKIKPPSAQMSLKNGQLHGIEDQSLIVRFSSAFHRDKASSPDSSRQLEELIAAEFGHKLRLKCVLESELHTTPLASESSVDLAAAALDVF